MSYKVEDLTLKQLLFLYQPTSGGKGEGASRQFAEAGLSINSNKGGREKMEQMLSDKSALFEGQEDDSGLDGMIDSIIGKIH